MKSLLGYFKQRFLPRWIVLAIDTLIVLSSWLSAYLLRYNFNFYDIAAAFNVWEAVLILPVILFCFRTAKSYSGVLRQSTTEDIMRIISSMLCTGLILAFISTAGRYLPLSHSLSSLLIIPYSIIITMATGAAILMIISRLIARLLFLNWQTDKKSLVNVMIFGAGKRGMITRNALTLGDSYPCQLAGFIDDNTMLQNKYIAGVPICSTETAFQKIIPQKNVSELIFAVNPYKITNKRKREITDLCIEHGISVKEVPAAKEWINGKFNAAAIRPIKIEDLLGRDSIQLDCMKISNGLKDSVVLVTGAAGSIGSEIVRQLIVFQVKHVVLLDKAESDLFNFQQEIIVRNTTSIVDYVIGDVTNREKMRKIFARYRPSIVFNAAAYKHVPLMEEFPCEAIRVNVGGTKNLADLSIEFGVDKFVFISTDKAVNPTNVMGASKRISEIYIQALSQSGQTETRFITTRFGNVLGSNGSVVPIFKKQIEMGGPITVTHKDITRYFMTIPEASQLVLEAGFMGRGGEIFVFDMGEPVKIYDLAKKMIALSGYLPGQDIEIRITGLRPGEKLYEELLDNKEELMPTHNNSILIGKVRKHDYQTVNNQVNELLKHADHFTPGRLINGMMHIVPEFISRNPFCIDEKQLANEKMVYAES